MSNMKQVAKMAGVSLGTVSNVLNGSAHVKDNLRKRVLDVVNSLDYQPSQLARGLRRDKTNMIGMVIPDITNPFFPAVVRGAEDVAFSNGYRLILCNTDNDHAKELAHLNELRTYLPAGLLVIPSNFSDLTAQVASYRKSGTAVVCVDRLPKRWDGDSATVANKEGAFQASRYLIELGHRCLATITGPLHLTNALQRVDGFKHALAEAGISLSPTYFQETNFDRIGGYSKALLLLRMLPRPTAIFAGNDMIALGVLHAIRELGLRCPEDVSVMGFDDLDFDEFTSPSLSSVFQPGYQLGATAAHMLFERMQGSQGLPVHNVLQTQLKVRGSVGPPPKPSAAAPRRSPRKAPVRRGSLA